MASKSLSTLKWVDIQSGQQASSQEQSWNAHTQSAGRIPATCY
jgi:hypothetical protein